MKLNEKEPLWLPNGSVRALMTVVLVAFTCYMYGSGKGANLPEYWEFIFLGVLGTYFGVRTLTKNDSTDT